MVLSVITMWMISIVSKGLTVNSVVVSQINPLCLASIFSVLYTVRIFFSFYEDSFSII